MENLSQADLTRISGHTSSEMSYFTAYHSSSTSSPARTASNGSVSTSVDVLSQIGETNPDSLWLNDDSEIVWDLDVPQDLGAIFDYEVHLAPSNGSTSISTAHSGQAHVKEKTSLPTSDKALRRREQNRASQRLFRERKIHYVKGIEQQLEELNEKYQDLIVSFNTQAKEKAALLSRIAKLKAQLENKD